MARDLLSRLRDDDAPRRHACAPQRGAPADPWRDHDGTGLERRCRHAAVPAQDRQFLYSARESSEAKAAMDRLALRQATTRAVKDFARQALAMEQDRASRLAAVARAYRQPLPTAPNEESRDLHDDLAAVTGSAFDDRFIRNAIAEMHNSINLYEDEGFAGKSAVIRGFVAHALPILQRIYQSGRQAELQLPGAAPLMSPSGTIDTQEPSPPPMPG